MRTTLFLFLVLISNVRADELPTVERFVDQTPLTSVVKADGVFTVSTCILHYEKEEKITGHEAAEHCFKLKDQADKGLIDF
jgi:hypothetical protein